MSSPAKSRPNGSPTKTRPSTSPTKGAKTTTTTTTTVKVRFTEVMLDQREKADLQLALKERDVELEHKLNTLIALNEKLSVFNDLQKDVAENQKIFRESEAAREELQATLTRTAIQVKEDTDLKEKYQNSLLQEISQLKDDLQAEKVEAARVKKVHIDEVETVRRECADEVARITKAKDAEIAALKRTHADEMEK